MSAAQSSKTEGGASGGGGGDGAWSDDALLKRLKWYHGTMSRHVAEALLLSNGIEGTYLMRRSPNDPARFAVSVKTHAAVVHFQVAPEARPSGLFYLFGQRAFASLADFELHFRNVPALSGDACIMTPLKHPYRRDFADADHAYRQVTRIRIVKERASRKGKPVASDDAADGLTPFLGSREGFLLKVGRVRKSIHERWFVMCRMKLAYYKFRDTDRTPIRVMDLLQCSRIERLENQRRPNCFVLMFPKRKLVLFAPSAIERETWCNLIQWKLDQRDAAYKAGSNLKRERDMLEAASPLENMRLEDDSDYSDSSDDDVGLDELPPLKTKAS